MKRPELNTNISVKDFEDFYWLKEELIHFCKANKISSIGDKKTLAERIVVYLQTGAIIQINNRSVSKSKFDWNNETLSLDTIITDNYKNTENVRAFMTNEIGSHFHFNTAFMKWVKENTGSTMKEAIAEWKRIHEQKKDKNYKPEIPSQFEYNTYIRDFLVDNKDKTIKEAIKYWKLKRSQRGDNVYTRDDLQLIITNKYLKQILRM